MADVFFSYSSKDRERVRPIHNALVADGFDVFWDQEVPPGRNWDEWIRQHLEAARCAVVFWSVDSVRSDNVVHEATVAKNAGKLIPVLLDGLEARQFPMGHYTIQAITLSAEPNGADAFSLLKEAIEAKAMRRWMWRKLAEAERRGINSTIKDQEMQDTNAALVKQIKGLREELLKAKNKITEDSKNFSKTQARHLIDVVKIKSHYEKQKEAGDQQIEKLSANLNAIYEHVLSKLSVNALSDLPPDFVSEIPEEVRAKMLRRSIKAMR